MAVIEFACLNSPMAQAEIPIFPSLALFDQLKIQAKDCLYCKNTNGFFSISEQRDAHITVGGMEMSVCESITAGYKLLPNDCYFFAMPV